MKKQLTFMFLSLVILLTMISTLFGRNSFAALGIKNVVNTPPKNPTFPISEGYTPLQFDKPNPKKGPSVAGPGNVGKIPVPAKEDKLIPPAPATIITPPGAVPRMGLGDMDNVDEVSNEH